MSTPRHEDDGSTLEPALDYVVYRLLGEDFKVLYIGCTGNLVARFRGHRSTKPWWNEVICYSLEHFGVDRDAALAAESEAILAVRPPYCKIVERRPIADRFWEKVAIGTPDECWNWTASLTNGIGQFALESTRCRTAPSFAYELTHGVRSSHSLCVTQACGNRLCVNPRHLVLGERKRRTHCKSGHAFTPANTYVAPSTGSRQCRKCIAANCRAYDARQKALRA